MKPITKWLIGPDAAEYPFPYQICDRLRRTTQLIQGTFRNAKYAATEQGGPFWITFYLEPDNGKITQIPLND
jgi:hypothetical protein